MPEYAYRDWLVEQGWPLLEEEELYILVGTDNLIHRNEGVGNSILLTMEDESNGDGYVNEDGEGLGSAYNFFYRELGSIKNYGCGWSYQDDDEHPYPDTEFRYNELWDDC
jgi:hypothetical protein